MKHKLSKDTLQLLDLSIASFNYILCMTETSILHNLFSMKMFSDRCCCSKSIHMLIHILDHSWSHILCTSHFCLDICSSDPCFGGTCEIDAGGFICICPPGTAGPTCETPLPPESKMLHFTQRITISWFSLSFLFDLCKLRQFTSQYCLLLGESKL